MIVITGAAGFIGSNLVSKLNSEGYFELILVDDFNSKVKNRNLKGKKFSKKIDRMKYFDWVKENKPAIEIIFHLGARTDTTEFDRKVLDELNLEYSKKIWSQCTGLNIPLIYASSAATYGLGELGYKDKHEIIPDLKPLNPYGESKNDFDKWVLEQSDTPPSWAGIKFFNVFGPNEYHKGRMASVVFHAFNQIRETGKMSLFRSHRPDFNDGEQERDFIYVKDVADVLFFFLLNEVKSGIYNLGTGRARTFLDLVKATFQSMDLQENIEFIDTPEDIRDKYQYFTEADMDKLHKAGYILPFSSLEQGIDDYVNYYLQEKNYN